jgi:hypothetical protein
MGSELTEAKNITQNIYKYIPLRSTIIILGDFRYGEYLTKHKNNLWLTALDLYP